MLQRVLSPAGTFTKRGLVLLPAASIAIALSVVATATSASAHVTVQLYGATAASGGYGAAFLRVPHGCAGDATNAIAVTIPDGIDPAGVKPQQKAGWEVTRSGSTIVWSKGVLPDSEFDDFGLNLKWPTLSPGEASRKIYFPTVQTCSAEVRVDRSGRTATVEGSFPQAAGKQVGIFADQTRVGVATVATNGALTFASRRVPEGAVVSVRRGGVVLGTSTSGSEAWVQLPGDGSDQKRPAPSVTVMASAGAMGH